MPLATWPAYAIPTEARLVINNAIPKDYRSQVNRAAPFPALFREVWFASIALAPMSRANAELFAAFCETLDGRVTAFKIAMTAGVFTRSSSTGLALLTTTTPGASTIRITVPTGGFYPGTLISLGDIETSSFQLLEVLDTVAAGTRTINIAPRIRHVFTAGVTCASGSDVFGKFNLATDSDGRARVNVSHGRASVQFTEAVA